MDAKERAREWSGCESVQQVFVNGYFKNSTAAATAIHIAGEIIGDLLAERAQARNDALWEAANIANAIDSGRGNEAEIARAIEALMNDDAAGSPTPPTETG